MTEQDGTLTRSGQITDEGGSCLVLRENESDELYSLTGATDGLEPGDPAVVKGRVAEASICMQGTTIGVTRVEIALNVAGIVKFRNVQIQRLATPTPGDS